MNRDDIIRMAREAGLGFKKGSSWGTHAGTQRFAQLVAAAEREACAKRCDALHANTLAAQSGDPSDLGNVMLRQVATLGHAECAAEIRARGAA